MTIITDPLFYLLAIPAILALGAALLPVAVLANYAGIWLVRRTPAELFFRIAYVLMFLISIELIRGALMEMLRN